MRGFVDGSRQPHADTRFTLAKGVLEVGPVLHTRSAGRGGGVGRRVVRHDVLLGCMFDGQRIVCILIRVKMNRCTNDMLL